MAALVRHAWLVPTKSSRGHLDASSVGRGRTRRRRPPRWQARAWIAQAARVQRQAVARQLLVVAMLVTLALAVDLVLLAIQAPIRQNQDRPRA